MLGPNPWATMMAQQQMAVAHAQAQVAAAQAHAQALQQQLPPPHLKSDVVTEDKLQDKGKCLTNNQFLLTIVLPEIALYDYSSEMAATSVQTVFRQAKTGIRRSPERRHACGAYQKNYSGSWRYEQQKI